MQRLTFCCRLGGQFSSRESSLKVWTLSHEVTSLRTMHSLSTKSFKNLTRNVCHNDTFSKYFVQPYRQKGHAKWQNIRHIKASNEDKMKAITERLLRAVSVAIKEGGETNPEFNPRLRHVLETAQHHSVPKATLVKHIKIAEESAKDAKPLTVECRGPFGSAMIIEAMASKPHKARNTVQSVLKRYGATQHNISSVKLLFEHKGIIEACVHDGKDNITEDRAEEIAIEAGAEEVTISKDEAETKAVFQFICDTQDFGTVRKGIEEQGLHIIGSYLGYIPNSYVDTPKDAVEVIAEFIEKLESIEEVVRVYDNFKLPS